MTVPPSRARADAPPRTCLTPARSRARARAFQGDAGLVTTVKGRRYVAVGFARRPYNEEAGSRYLRSVFERAHDALDTQHPDAAVAAIEYPVVGTALYDEFVEAMRDRSPDGVRHRKKVVERRMAGRW